MPAEIWVQGMQVQILLPIFGSNWNKLFPLKDLVLLSTHHIFDSTLNCVHQVFRYSTGTVNRYLLIRFHVNIYVSYYGLDVKPGL